MLFLAWRSYSDPGINFLSRDGAAEWIIFPVAVAAQAHNTASLDAIFRREFTVAERPQSAQLHWRGAKRVELKINDTLVATNARNNWKEVSRAEIAGFLQPGRNVIEARVYNDDAPPALWLAITTDRIILRTDQTWETSLAGSAWRPAALATKPPLPGPGNPIFSGETTFHAVATVWPWWLLLAGIALLICVAGWWWRVLARVPSFIWILVVASLWLLLFWNNARLLRTDIGFDARAHNAYVTYIQEHRALPWPTEGFEMFQPPLYYLVSAALLSSVGATVNGPAGSMALRMLGAFCGIAQFVLVFLCLRLLLPNQIKAHLVGLLLAAFLPMQLYLAHYVTNETMAATLVTAAVYFGLRVLKNPETSVWGYVWLGLCLGAAMLTKATGLLALPPLLLVLVMKMGAERHRVVRHASNLAVMLVVCFAVCGWHYIRIWHRFGTPLLGNWDPAAGFSWWQDPGYHTIGDYLRFGRCLVRPLFSGLNGFPDGIYSTLWGDGLCGGVADMAYPPPWNYDLMVAGYLIAAVPTLIILGGAIIAFTQLVRRPSTDQILLFGLCGSVLLGLIFMTLKVASYAQMKAFYALCMLLPICFFGVVGWNSLTKRLGKWQFLAGIVLLTWALNSFASVWVRSTPAQHLFIALRLRDKQPDLAVSEARKAVESDPYSSVARRSLASLLEDIGNTDAAVQEAERAVALSPMDSACHAQLSSVLAKKGEMDRATDEGRLAVKLGPENGTAYDVLLACLLQRQLNNEAVNVARDGLAVSPRNAELHFALGLATAREADFVTAATQFGYSLLLRPAWNEARAKLRLVLISIAETGNGAQGLHQIVSLVPDSPVMLNDLAWFLSTHPDPALRDGPVAIRLAERACAATGRKFPMLVATLSAAYAETGKYNDAVRTAEEARSLAQISGSADQIASIENLLAYFRENRPYRDEQIMTTSPSP